MQLSGSPVAALGRVVAVAEAEGPAAGLALTDDLDLNGYHYLHATRAAYGRALELVHDQAERRLVERRMAGLTDGGRRS